LASPFLLAGAKDLVRRQRQGTALSKGPHRDWKFLGDLNHDAKEGTVAIVINKASQTITVTTHAPGNALYNTGFTVAAVDGSCCSR
jgi:hypothetical protein